MTKQEAGFSARWLRPGHVLLAVVFVALVAHVGNLRNGFTNWDDPGYILKNPLIREFGFGPAARLFTQFYYNDYYPLNQLSYMIDHAIWGTNPLGYHLTNVVLHALAAGLAFLVALRLLKGIVAPSMAALTFAVHPVNVESVAWLSERKNVLSMVFFLLSFLLYLQRERWPQRDKSLLVGSVAAFLAAALSKTIVTPFPVLLLVYDYLFRGLTIRRVVEKLPYFVVSGLVAALTVMSQGEAGAIPPYIGGSIINNLWTMLVVYVIYLRMLVWPTGLSARYPAEFALSPWDPRVLLGMAVVGALLWGAWYLRKRYALGSFCIVWFFAMLLPVSHLIPTSVLYADRYLYYPCLAFGWIVGDGLRRLKRPAWLSLALGAGAVALWTIATVSRTADWRDSITLWTRAIEVHPDNFFAEAILGDAYVRDGQLSKGLSHKQRGLSLAAKSRWRHIHTELVNTGIVHLALDNDDEAEKLFDMALGLDSGARYGPTYKGLGMLAEKRGEIASAKFYYLAAIANGGGSERALVGLRRCLGGADSAGEWQRFKQAPRAYLQAAADARRRKARESIGEGNLRQARSRLNMARLLAPNDQGIVRDLAIVQRRLNSEAE